MLTSLSMGAALAHLMEMPAKLAYDGKLWLHLLQTLYPTFGKVSGLCEIGAVIAAIVLTLASRKRHQSFRWVLPSALFLAATHAIFWIWVAPVNARLVPLPPEALPLDWASWRQQWEFAHAARAILQILALGTLVISILAELPNLKQYRQKGKQHDSHAL
jgi:hypothetical protein